MRFERVANYHYAKAVRRTIELLKRNRERLREYEKIGILLLGVVGALALALNTG